MEPWVEAPQIFTGREKSLFPFALTILNEAGCGRRPGSAMNSLRSAWTVVLAGRKTIHYQGEGELPGGDCSGNVQLANNDPTIFIDELLPSHGSQWI